MLFFSLQIWSLLCGADSGWTGPPHQRALHCYDGSDWLPHGDQGLCGGRDLYGAAVWHVRVAVESRLG